MLRRITNACATQRHTPQCSSSIAAACWTQSTKHKAARRLRQALIQVQRWSVANPLLPLCDAPPGTRNRADPAEIWAGIKAFMPMHLLVTTEHMEEAVSSNFLASRPMQLLFMVASSSQLPRVGKALASLMAGAALPRPPILGAPYCRDGLSSRSRGGRSSLHHWAAHSTPYCTRRTDCKLCML